MDGVSGGNEMLAKASRKASARSTTWSTAGEFAVGKKNEALEPAEGGSIKVYTLASRVVREQFSGA